VTYKLWLGIPMGSYNTKESLLVTLVDQNIDVSLISKTHFTRELYIKLRGFEVYRTIHPSNCAKGGSAVIIKTGISHYEDIKIETEEFRVTSDKIKTPSGTLTVAAIYSSPRHNLKRLDYLSLLQSVTGTFIIGGDLNSKNTYWGSRLTNTKGRELYQAARGYHCEVHTTGRPTYWPADTNKIPYLIYFFVSKNLSTRFIDVTEGFDLDSDHSPIVLTLSETIIKKGRNTSLSSSFTDWDLFRVTVVNRINLRVALTTNDELEDEVQKFVTDIQHSAREATPLVTKKGKGFLSPLLYRHSITDYKYLR